MTADRGDVSLHERGIPAVVVVLGALAVVPFAAGALAVWLAPLPWRPVAAFALSAYAATVVSFIGAIHWGIAFTRESPPARSFVWGVVPAIVAWLALLLPPHAGLVVHAVVLMFCYGVDRVAYVQDGVGRWLPLRRWLTVFAVAGCLAGAVGS